MFTFNVGPRLLAVFAVVSVLYTARVESQCTTRHCNSDDDDETVGLVFSMRQRLAKQEETILSLKATIDSQSDKLNELEKMTKADSVRYDESLKQLQRETTTLKELQAAQNASCCGSIDRLQQDMAAMKVIQNTLGKCFS